MSMASTDEGMLHFHYLIAIVEISIHFVGIEKNVLDIAKMVSFFHFIIIFTNPQVSCFFLGKMFGGVLVSAQEGRFGEKERWRK